MYILYLEFVIGFLMKHSIRLHCMLIFVNSSEDLVDRGLLHAVESVIIDWAHQIQTVLKRDSSQPLLEGLNPVPFTELNFWKARAINLECIFEQVYAYNLLQLSILLYRHYFLLANFLFIMNIFRLEVFICINFPLLNFKFHSSYFSLLNYIYIKYIYIYLGSLRIDIRCTVLNTSK